MNVNYYLADLRRVAEETRGRGHYAATLGHVREAMRAPGLSDAERVADVTAVFDALTRVQEELDAQEYTDREIVLAESDNVGTTPLEVRSSGIAGRSVHLWTGVSAEDLMLTPAAARHLGEALIRAAGTGR